VVKAGTGTDGGRGVIPLIEQYKRVLGAASEQWTVHEQRQPGQYRLQKDADEILHKRRHVGQVERAAAQGRW
jgi:hypothetical protein